VDEERVLEKNVVDELALVRDMVDEGVVVEGACVGNVTYVDDDNVLVRDTDVAHVHGQSWVACGMLQTAKRHQGGSQVVVVDEAVVAVVPVAVVAVIDVSVVVDVSVAQEQLQT